MKSCTYLALAAGLIALTAVGCAQTSTGGGAAAPAGGTAATTGGAGGAAAGGGEAETRNFNLQVRCPGVHLLKSKGWTDQQIMQQLQVSEDQIPACEQYVASLPKGYVPPPPPGVTASAAPAPAAPGAHAAPAPKPQ